MTEQEKQILLVDLCARLPYRQKVCYKIHTSSEEITETLSGVLLDYFKTEKIEIVRPYLRPMSSMTEEEQFQLGRLLGAASYNLLKGECSSLKELLEYFYKNHIDLFGLIPKGLALEAPEVMYK